MGAYQWRLPIELLSIELCLKDLSYEDISMALPDDNAFVTPRPYLDIRYHGRRVPTQMLALMALPRYELS